MAELLELDYVYRNKTKTQGRGWKIVCPDCGGNDLWYTDDNGRAFCFECGVTYKVRDNEEEHETPDEELHCIDVPAVRSVYRDSLDYYRDSLNKEHKAFLYSRGLDDTAIDTFAVGYCPDDVIPVYNSPYAIDSGVVNLRRKPILAERVIFPYIADGEVTDLRGRTVTGQDPKYRSPKQRSQARGAVFPFNYARAMEMARDQKLIIVTEGELKAIVADMFGFPAVAFPGMTSWKPALIVSEDIRVVVVFDSNSDPKDRMRVDKALYKLSTRLPFFDVVSLPLLGENKMDIDSFLLHKLGGYNRFKYYIDAAVPFDHYRKLRRF